MRPLRIFNRKNKAPFDTPMAKYSLDDCMCDHDDCKSQCNAGCLHTGYAYVFVSAGGSVNDTNKEEIWTDFNIFLMVILIIIIFLIILKKKFNKY